MAQLHNQPFPIKVRLWLNHKVVLSYHSPHYQNQIIQESLKKCQAIVKMVRANCGGYNIGAICNLIRVNEEHLKNILPNPNNPSYEKAVNKLNEILTYAKQYSQNEQRICKK